LSTNINTTLCPHRPALGIFPRQTHTDRAIYSLTTTLPPYLSLPLAPPPPPPPPPLPLPPLPWPPSSTTSPPWLPKTCHPALAHHRRALCRLFPSNRHWIPPVSPSSPTTTLFFFFLGHLPIMVFRRLLSSSWHGTQSISQAHPCHAPDIPRAPG